MRTFLFLFLLHAILSAMTGVILLVHWNLVPLVATVYNLYCAVVYYRKDRRERRWSMLDSFITQADQIKQQ